MNYPSTFVWMQACAIIWRNNELFHNWLTVKVARCVFHFFLQNGELQKAKTCVNQWFSFSWKVVWNLKRGSTDFFFELPKVKLITEKSVNSLIDSKKENVNENGNENNAYLKKLQQQAKL